MTTQAEDILDRLPHRPPFRFLTAGIELRDGQAAEAVWRVSGEEAFFRGHFPGHPIVPGVLIGEALAQLSGLIVADRTGQGADATSPGAGREPLAGKLAHLDVRFNASVSPPAEIMLSSRLERVVGSLWQFDILARVGDKRAARGTLTLSVAGVPTAAVGK